ncbi:MAG: MBL fold metallo-hydrolase [Bacteroidetes bacterium]|nr:MAG: MBL fold metallo-hydrolase [Bacteroidota bacterium]
MKPLSIFIMAASLLVGNANIQAQRNLSDSDITKLVLLGTGNPNPDPKHSGCSLALVVNNCPYIIDFGPGLVRQFAAVTGSYGGPLKELAVKDLKTAFVTHLHSDHTAGYPDLILTPWVLHRDEPLKVYGPKGIARMTHHILEAYREDIHYRMYGAEPGNIKGWEVECHEFDAEGEIYRDSNIIVEAIPVVHGSWPYSFGYRFTTPDKVIVASGDATPSEKIVEYARGADILIHEVYSKAGYDKRNAEWQAYHKGHHTSTLELAALAKEAKPKKLLLYHTLFWGAEEEDLLNEIRSIYDGEVYVGRDLDIF